MTLLATILAAAAQAAVARQWRAQWRARPAAPGFSLATATWVALAPSTRTTIALATGAGMILAESCALWLVTAIVWLASATGLDAAAWVPASIDIIFVTAVTAGAADLAVLGLYRSPLVAPALRHTLIGLALPTVLVAGWPLLAQSTTDGAAALGGVPEVAACAPAELRGDAVAGYGAAELANAKVIVDVGQEMGVPQRGWLIGVATSMQEAALRNIDYGDRDSLGLFQQRPSQGWGTEKQVQDPVYASRKFYETLLQVDGWQDLPLWQAAQTVQRSAYPTAYAKHEDDAAQVVGAVAGTTCRS